MRKKVNWVLDADIRGFFEPRPRWLVKFLEHRIADRRVLRLIQKWLAAGVIEDGAVDGDARRARRKGHRFHRCSRTSTCTTSSTSGPTSGGGGTRAATLSSCGSPTTTWWASSIVRTPSGSCADLRERFAKFGLELAPGEDAADRVRAVRRRATKARGLRKPETLGRAGARCRRCRRSVSPTRPPNRTCAFLRIRLSTGHAMADRDAGFQATADLRPSGGPSCPVGVAHGEGIRWPR